jgi:hypothetical protein
MNLRVIFVRYRGFWIVNDDIRRARAETTVQRATGWHLDSALMGAEEG